MWQRLLAIALIVGGLAMLYPRTLRFASVVLGVAYGVFTLACVPGMIAAPSTPLPYVNFFEQLSIVCGALAVYAATETIAAQASTLGRAGRLALGVCTISFAWAQVVYIQYTASLVPA